jgi:hypothetical protein
MDAALRSTIHQELHFENSIAFILSTNFLPFESFDSFLKHPIETAMLYFPTHFPSPIRTPPSTIFLRALALISATLTSITSPQTQWVS